MQNPSWLEHLYKRPEEGSEILDELVIEKARDEEQPYFGAPIAVKIRSTKNSEASQLSLNKSVTSTCSSQATAASDLLEYRQFSDQEDNIAELILHDSSAITDSNANELHTADKSSVTDLESIDLAVPTHSEDTLTSLEAIQKWYDDKLIEEGITPFGWNRKEWDIPEEGNIPDSGDSDCWMTNNYPDEEAEGDLGDLEEEEEDEEEEEAGTDKECPSPYTKLTMYHQRVREYHAEETAELENEICDNEGSSNWSKDNIRKWKLPESSTTDARVALFVGFCSSVFVVFTLFVFYRLRNRAT